MTLFTAPPPGWNDIESAPRDRPAILLTFQGHVVKAAWQTGFTDENGRDTGAWCATEEGQHPPCWSEGVCWASNEDESPSDPPVAWLPFPAPSPPAVTDCIEGPQRSARDTEIHNRAAELLLMGWQPCFPPLIPRRTVEGRWTLLVGMTFRRPKAVPTRWSAWHYVQLPETDEEREMRAW
ncbi:MAG: hypothetical protein DI527_00875 [Chelatococcus sp.]|nr:MAG: hypothetical protein DI527_00875 [Chelatococcus sp.]